MGENEPTGAVCRVSQRLPHPSQFARLRPIASPHQYRVVVPARATYSHSASLGSRYERPRLAGEPAHVRLRVVPAHVDHRSIPPAPALVVGSMRTSARPVARVPLGKRDFVDPHRKGLA